MAAMGFVLANRPSATETDAPAPFGPALSTAELTAMLEAPARKRTRLCDLSPNLHCSILGTCLSTTELRQIVSKALGRDLKDLSDHDIHSEGVLLAGRRDPVGKLLHKALDRRHQATINRFAKAATADEVAALWADAKRAGDIPGAYWAALSHPATTDTVAQMVFADVHMLSHLVGAANRADIRRLAVLEEERVELERKLQNCQADLHAVTATIRQLNTALAAAQANPRPVAADPAGTGPGASDAEAGMLRRLVADLEGRLRVETTRRLRAEECADRYRRQEATVTDARKAAEDRADALGQELAALEAHFQREDEGEAESEDPGDETAVAPQLPTGISTMLYVGGRPNQVHYLRDFAGRVGMTLLHHDGGFEDRPGLLAGLVSRADAACFPVDCVSHDAVAAVKRFCRQAAKPYLPLRSAGIGSFLAGLAKLAASNGDALEP